jgi:hypothetical protein
MDKKKVIRSMYANACGKDVLRPIFSGIHFEKNRCYGTDSKILVVFNQGSAGKADQTLTLTGEPIEGKYPRVDAVFPRDVEKEPLNIDLDQLYQACRWAQMQEGATKTDAVVILHKAFSIQYLVRMLNIFTAAGELREAQLFGNDPKRPSVIRSTSLLGLIMPKQFMEEDIDAEKSYEGEARCLSYENLINDYVFNSWKPKKVKDDLDWLD